MFISSIVAEVLRIARVTSTIQSFLNSVHALIKRMRMQGAKLKHVEASTNKIINKHWEDFEKYSVTSRRLTSYMFSKFIE